MRVVNFSFVVYYGIYLLIDNQIPNMLFDTFSKYNSEKYCCCHNIITIVIDKRGHPVIILRVLIRLPMSKNEERSLFQFAFTLTGSQISMLMPFEIIKFRKGEIDNSIDNSASQLTPAILVLYCVF